MVLQSAFTSIMGIALPLGLVLLQSCPCNGAATRLQRRMLICFQASSAQGDMFVNIDKVAHIASRTLVIHGTHCPKSATRHAAVPQHVGGIDERGPEGRVVVWALVVSCWGFIHCVLRRHVSVVPLAGSMDKIVPISHGSPPLPTTSPRLTHSFHALSRLS